MAVRGGSFFSWLTGIDPVEPRQLSDFHIDKSEVTNRQFKHFIQNGGYGEREHWDQPFVVNGATIPWEQGAGAPGRRDRTTRPGHVGAR